MVNWHARVDGNHDVRFMDVGDVLLFIIIFLGRLSLLFCNHRSSLRNRRSSLMDGRRVG